MHQPHDARRLAQSHGLEPDIVALRSNLDERFGGLDSSRLPDTSRLPPHRRLESQQPNHVAPRRAIRRISRRIRGAGIPIELKSGFADRFANRAMEMFERV